MCNRYVHQTIIESGTTAKAPKTDPSNYLLKAEPDRARKTNWNGPKHSREYFRHLMCAVPTRNVLLEFFFAISTFRKL